MPRRTKSWCFILSGGIQGQARDQLHGWFGDRWCQLLALLSTASCRPAVHTGAVRLRERPMHPQRKPMWLHQSLRRQIWRGPIHLQWGLSQNRFWWLKINVQIINKKIGCISFFTFLAFRGIQWTLQLWVRPLFLAPEQTGWLWLADQSREHSNSWHGACEWPHSEEPLRPLPLPGKLLPSGSWRHGTHIRTSAEPQELTVQREMVTQSNYVDR